MSSHKNINETNNFRDNVFSESPMSDEYFVRSIATGEWGVCLVSSCKVRYPQNKNIFLNSLTVKILSLDIKYMMLVLLYRKLTN